MGKGFRLVTSLLLLLLFFVFPGTKASTEPIEEEKDITTPLATNPTTSVPTVVPNSDSDASAVVTTPLTVPSPPRVAAHPGESWCVARENAPKLALQAALDYACGIGGADCSEIQEGGKCYNPNSLIAHASFAFNSYYQKNPIPSSCNFGGSAVTISGDPSVGSCHFPSTSTNESTLNVSEDGLGLFGRIPSHPTPKPEASSSSSRTFSYLYFHSHLLCFWFCFYIMFLWWY
ncbi:glucan endo-1,3-beta-glucosidase 3 [Raphanus sativus]|uniref:Glucan endo-1,3-beta-glucosidase 3 n=1 Tax=Raphanus sativus TaxID=3726 RepID=A0A6J0N0R9_RAPSA|nr:glucan endo-1,3-beta-glucosidase 3 [Raphanus sativus]